ncbi:MAG TPA: spore cortex biosynthesis protein YabQ [Bacillota bacterium]|nr:hypothetical protein [Bacillota bacterium]HOA34896.1 spore cortex biosynthesis protein YabQ [Bacillota bacterium]HOJ84190.1 spore cortex biosynthesis protein YabQ [Bacillota bacterium]HOL14606.1 spore cortex biosynthesis protein YabQ [Bacillota bacterium]HPZ10764.1 spore cortex biosynthesis protein YabQ [Bacillota bacterium]
MAAFPASSQAIQQLIAFSEAMAMGVIYAAVYDIYRSLRMQFRRLPAALSVVADCLFWVAAAVATIFFLFYRRQGEIHLYTYGGLTAGFIVYFYFFSGYLLPFWLKGFGFLFRAGQCRSKSAGPEEGPPVWKSRIFHFLRRK